MAGREIPHVISSSSDSTIVAQVLEKRLMRKRKYFAYFEKFAGQLLYCPDDPKQSRLILDIDAGSIVCRDRSLRASRQRHITRYLRDSVLDAAAHPTIQFSSRQLCDKALRGMVLEGVLTARGTTRVLRMNAVFIPSGRDRLEIEADSIFRFSEFGVKAPSSLLGIGKTNDEVLVHLHLYAIPQEISSSSPTSGVLSSSNPRKRGA
jgi:polyisoprenoid-binding protein YceI